MVNQICLVGIGGLAGAVARYWVNLTFSSTKSFPLGTFFVNMTGSFFMGILLGAQWLPLTVSLLVGTGFLGAYTTFSTFNFELFLLNKGKRRFMFIFYLGSSYCLGIFLAGIGYLIGRI